MRNITDPVSVSAILLKAQDVALGPSVTDGFLYHVDALPFVDPRVIEFLRVLCEANDTHRFYLAVLDPDPMTYYFRHFNWVPVYELSNEDTLEQYMRLLYHDPHSSPADAIGHRADVIAIFEPDFKWFIKADRELDLATVWSKASIQESAIAFPHLMTDNEYAERVRDLCL